MDDSTQPVMPSAQPTPPPEPAAPPPVAWTPPARQPLPGSVVGAAVVLLVLGVLTGLLAAIFLLSGSLYDQVPSSAFGNLTEDQLRQARDFSRGIGTGVGILAGVFALAHLGSGAGIFRRATWARVIGMVLAGIGILFTGLLTVAFVVAVTGGLPVTTVSNSGLSPEEMQQAMRVGAVFGLVVFGVCLLAYLFTLVALIRNGRAFR
jgi:hypothetical protein